MTAMSFSRPSSRPKVWCARPVAGGHLDKIPAAGGFWDNLATARLTASCRHVDRAAKSRSDHPVSIELSGPGCWPRYKSLLLPAAWL